MYKAFKFNKIPGEPSIWGVSNNKKQILKLSPDDGTVVEQINLDSVLNMTSSTVTSKLMVARSSEGPQDILILVFKLPHLTSTIRAMRRATTAK